MQDSIVDPQTAELYAAVDAVTHQTVTARRANALRNGRGYYSLQPDVARLNSSRAVVQKMDAAGQFYLSLLPLEGEAEIIAAKRDACCKIAGSLSAISTPKCHDFDRYDMARALYLGRAFIFLEILRRWHEGRANTPFRKRVAPRVLIAHTNAIYRALYPWSAQSTETGEFYGGVGGRPPVPRPAAPRPSSPRAIAATIRLAAEAAEADPHGWGDGPPPTPNTNLAAALQKRPAIEAMVRP